MNERQLKKGAEYRDQYLSGVLNYDGLVASLKDLGWTPKEIYLNWKNWFEYKEQVRCAQEYDFGRDIVDPRLKDIVRVEKTRKEGESW